MRNENLTTRLQEQPHLFDFFQAVRLLEWVNHEQAQTQPKRKRFAIGHDKPQHREVTYFSALPSLQFPASEIAKLVWRPSRDNVELPPQMLVTFMGLTGPAGAMPVHYTRELLNRIHLKDRVLKEFFDLFNHRSISFYFRAWEKYRFYMGYERSRREKTGDDTFTVALKSLAGLGTKGLKQRTTVSDDVYTYYAGHFSHHPRNAIGLQQILTDYFDMRIKVKAFNGDFVNLPREQQTRLPFSDGEGWQFNRLGHNTTLSSRAYNSQQRFRISVGPITQEQFNEFLPGTSALQVLKDIVRMYVGPEMSFDVQLVLQSEENVGTNLYEDTLHEPSRLGWNTWLGHKVGKVLDDMVLK